MERSGAANLPTRPLDAAAAMVAAMLVIGIIDNYISVIADDIGLWQFHVTRAVIAIPLVVVMGRLGLGALRPRRFGAVAIRSLLVATSMLFYFSALAMLPIAQALAGLFTSPIFILLISGLVFRETIGPWRIVAVVVGFAGVILVLSPDVDDFDIRLIVPVIAGFFYALGALATRRLCAGETTISMLLAMLVTLGTLGLVGSTVLLVFPATGDVSFVNRGWEGQIGPILPVVMLQAVGSVMGVFGIIRAYQLGPPSYVAVFEYSVMIFGPLFAWVVFGEALGPLQILGLGLIVAAGVVVSLRSASSDG